MNKNLPKLSNGIKVCIICEGNEEYFYLEKLNSLNVWNPKYKLILVNAEGNGNIPARYQNSFQNEDGAIILVFCDTEKKPYEQYIDIKNKINKFHGVENAADQVVIYGNPCTMQIVLQHWDDIKLKTAAKKMNATYIQKFTGVSNYKGKEEQINQVMKHITKVNYLEMSKRVQLLENDDSVVGSSNFSILINYLSSSDDSWIDNINKIIN